MAAEDHDVAADDVSQVATSLLVYIYGVAKMVY